MSTLSQLAVALVWLGVVSSMLVACAVFERRARLVPRPDRPELDPPRAFWGGDRRRPPAHSLTARALAAFARIVRSRSVVSDQRVGLRRLGRLGGCLTLTFGLSLIPFAGTWGGRLTDPPLVPLDLEHGLMAIGLILLLASLARVAVGLSERNAWSRIGSVRQASRAIAALALLTLVLVPLALGSGSLRLHEIVLDQQRVLAPVGWLLASLEGEFFEKLRSLHWPAWNLFVQPITALLFVPAMTLVIGSARIDDATSGAIGTAGLGLDADPIDLYWSRLEARLSSVLVSALFVTLFLGGGSIPFVDPAGLVPLLAPFVGELLPMLLVCAVHVGAFHLKWLLVLLLASRMKRLAAVSREDRAMRLGTRRLLPLAWANLLLVASASLWIRAFEGVVG